MKNKYLIDMKKMLIAIFFFTQLFIGGYGSKAKTYWANNEANFEDIDMFSLKGEKMLGTKPPYPYIKITVNGGNQRKISYFVNKDFNVEREYRKIDNYWTTNYIELGDTSKERVFEYILPDRIMTLSYLTNVHNQDLYLREVSVLKKWDETVYLIQRDLKMAPGIRVPDLVMPNVYITHKKQIRIKNGVLSIFEQTYDKNGKNTSNSKTCYDIGSCSYFQWLYLSLNKKTVVCN